MLLTFMNMLLVCFATLLYLPNSSACTTTYFLKSPEVHLLHINI